MRVLSGMQPSGQLHLGNYFGSMKPNLEHVGSADESFYFIADLHAMTTVQDKNVLRQAREDIVRDYLAAGFDPEKAIIYYQSAIPEHAELMWILSTLSPMGLLERAVSYKDKVERGISSSVGLFTYPILMAADILLYQADIVPVGKDQKQHVEIARDLAGKFNNVFGEVFILPEPQVKEEVAIVPGTDGQKMSKSYGNTIPLFGEEKVIQKAIMGIVTDSTPPEEPKDPSTNIIYNIHKLLLSEADAHDVAEEYKDGIGYGDAKKKLFESYMDYFSVMREEREKLTDEYVQEVLHAGAKKAQAVALSTMEKVRQSVGLS